MSWDEEHQQPANGSSASEHSTVTFGNGTESAVATAPGPVADESAGDEFKVFLTLADGERVESGQFPNEPAAHVHAEEFMAAASATAAAKWPRIGGRYFRPETIVSIDVERSDQPRWTGSTGRASSWNSR